ncbi:hypothetical protein Y1Q_0019383 [Alligator mississippiensis]|uniref:Uncharacterized protein n=1 Tax=Alligator mississippiensis TaxID=8496 RepID=A0A151MR16_ALLMI|nr:hypothetical protein Y1Q_0019383 [Alligator mississippiensis]
MPCCPPPGAHVDAAPTLGFFKQDEKNSVFHNNVAGYLTQFHRKWRQNKFCLSRNRSFWVAGHTRRKQAELTSERSQPDQLVPGMNLSNHTGVTGKTVPITFVAEHLAAPQ